MRDILTFRVTLAMHSPALNVWKIQKPPGVLYGRSEDFMLAYYSF